MTAALARNRLAKIMAGVRGSRIWRRTRKINPPFNAQKNTTTMRAAVVGVKPSVVNRAPTG